MKTTYFGWSRKLPPDAKSMNDGGTAADRVEIDLSDEHGRYHRQSLISWWDQERLRDASILVVGAGALGNELVKNLVLMGVGRIVVVDLDTIENSNLARCVFFRPDDEGRAKAEVLAERARELNADVEIIPVVGDIRLTTGLGIFAEADVVLGGLDNREARLFVNQACWKTSTPWVDGGIEGLMGVARVFVPPDTACYECTLSEHDYELMAARRSCALLTREDMIDGKVPTTSTTASIIAGMQVQEAVKLLHTERLGPSDLAGAGFQFVGLSHDSYVVRYTRREECLSHDTYDLENAIVTEPDATFGHLLELAIEKLGKGTALELEHEIALAGLCQSCGHSATINRPVDALNVGAGLCPECSEQWRLEFTHEVDEQSPLLDLTPADLGLPTCDVVVGRVGMERCFFAMTGPGSAIDLLKTAAAA